jgi:hypothetical protein
MVLHVFVFLLVVCLLFSLVLLWRLDWFHFRPSSSRGGAKRTTLHRLLSPRCPDDCPCNGYLGHPFKNRHVEREKDLPLLLANTGGWVYNQMSLTAYSCSNNDTLT